MQILVPLLMIIHLGGSITFRLRALASVMISERAKDCVFVWKPENGRIEIPFYKLVHDSRILVLSELYSPASKIPYIRCEYRYNIPNDTKEIAIEGEVNFDDTKELSKEEFNSKIRDKLLSLKFAPLIRNNIEHYSKYIDNNTYGIHIRRGHKYVYMRNSVTYPTELFVNKIKKIIDNDSDAKFFIASDSQYEIEYIYSLFPERVLYVDIESCYGEGLPIDSGETFEGAARSLIELFLLSKTKRIVGSWNSGFTYAAALIGNKESENVSGMLNMTVDDCNLCKAVTNRKNLGIV